MARLGRQEGEGRVEHGRSVGEAVGNTTTTTTTTDEGLELSLDNLMIINEYCSSLMEKIDQKN